MGGTILTAAGVFAGTNVDDLVVLTVLFLSARAVGRPRPWQVWAGQYAGIGVLVAVSVAAALGLAVVPDEWIRLLGLIPLALGVKGLVTAVRSRGSADDPAPVATGWAAVAGITIANGADNIAVYTPLLRTIGVPDAVLTIAVFAVGVAVWCLAGAWLGSHPRVVSGVRRFGHCLVPGVFVLLGVVILVAA
ncbi:cadmium resistance transporter [Luedemannella flava]|uniref:Cadmium resistance transporter n=1 Tax=Luedemannella flava TaxID=349316 RepID=A0ABP4XQQ3_9ACTN